MGKLINRIPGLRLLISSLPGSALRTLVESLGKPSRCQQAFSKPCLVNLISKDTHLVFTIYWALVSKINVKKTVLPTLLSEKTLVIVYCTCLGLKTLFDITRNFKEILKCQSKTEIIWHTMNMQMAPLS